MNDATYLVQVFKIDTEDPLAESEELFGMSGDFDSVPWLLKQANVAVLEDTGSRVLGSDIREGDVLRESDGVVTRIFDTQTTGSGRTFILAEVNGSRIVTFAADQTYAVTRL